MIRRKRRRIGDDENTDRWLLTYADLITLLLAFFVVLYSMSRIDVGRFDAISDALAGVLRTRHPISFRLPNPSTGDTFKGGPIKVGTLNLVQQQLEQRIVGQALEDELSLEMTERGLVIHVTESALFEEARADLDPHARDVLSLIADQIRDLPNEIQIEGHTDSRPINTRKFPSNWELSAARALSVVHYFIDRHGVPPDHISGAGYAEFRPVEPNSTPEGMAQNRRVDVVVLNEEHTKLQPRASGLTAGGTFRW